MTRAKTLGVAVSLLQILIFSSGIFAAAELSFQNRISKETDKALGGKIVNVRISPADSTYYSFEIIDKSRIELRINSSLSGTVSRVVHPRVINELGGKPQDFDLAWAPVKINGQIWAAFVSNALGSNAIWLYDLAHDSCSLLRSLEDSVGTATYADPAWSPDGGVLSYTRIKDGNSDIWYVYNMPEVVKSPLSRQSRERHRPLVVDGAEDIGNQQKGIWCPLEGSGYLIYEYIHTKTMKSELRVCDPLRAQEKYTYRVKSADTLSSHMQLPSWSPSGKLVAYYLSQSLEAESTAGSTDAYQRDLGLLKVSNPAGDSLLLEMMTGGRSGRSLRVQPVVVYLGGLSRPAWLPDGRHLLVPIYDEEGGHPLRMIDPRSWQDQDESKSWRLKLKAGADDYSYSRDVQIVKNRVAFSYLNASNGEQNLVIADLDFKPDKSKRDSLVISSDRKKAWSRFALGINRRPPWLIRSYAGPNVGLNTPAGTGLTTLTALCFLFGPCKPPDPIESIDWGVPNLPASGKGILRINIGGRF